MENLQCGFAGIHQCYKYHKSIDIFTNRNRFSKSITFGMAGNFYVAFDIALMQVLLYNDISYIFIQLKIRKFFLFPTDWAIYRSFLFTHLGECTFSENQRYLRAMKFRKRN